MKNALRRDIVVIGGSAGAFESLRHLLSLLPPSIPAQLFVTLHLPADYPSLLPELLSRGGWTVRQPTDHESFQPGVILVAPPNAHLLVEKSHVSLSPGPRENRHRPAIDVLFRSASRAYGPRVAAVILSGQLDDGSAGLMAVKMRNGLTIVQDPQEAAAPEMPSRAIQYARPDCVLPIQQIADLLIKSSDRNLPQAETSEEPMFDKAHKATKSSKVKNKPAGSSSSEELPLGESAIDEPSGPPSAFACPECHGVLFEIKDGELLRFRCRVGHAYTAEALRLALSETAENALWVALRVLEEKASLLRRLAQKAGPLTKAQFEEDAVGIDRHANTIRKMILESHTLIEEEETRGAA